MQQKAAKGNKKQQTCNKNASKGNLSSAKWKKGSKIGKADRRKAKNRKIEAKKRKRKKREVRFSFLSIDPKSLFQKRVNTLNSISNHSINEKSIIYDNLSLMTSQI